MSATSNEIDFEATAKIFESSAIATINAVAELSEDMDQDVHLALTQVGAQSAAALALIACSHRLARLAEIAELRI